MNTYIYIAGIAIGITGDAGVRATAQQPRMFVGMVSIYIKGGRFIIPELCCRS